MARKWHIMALEKVSSTTVSISGLLHSFLLELESTSWPASLILSLHCGTFQSVKTYACHLFDWLCHRQQLLHPGLSVHLFTRIGLSWLISYFINLVHKEFRELVSLLLTECKWKSVILPKNTFPHPPKWVPVFFFQKVSTYINNQKMQLICFRLLSS